MNFQESTTISNACTKKVWKLIKGTTYLGRIMCTDGFKADLEYVPAIREIEHPISKQVLQSLIDHLVCVRLFLETRLDEQIKTDTFSNLMHPIHELNKANKTSIRTEKVFQKIKNRVSSPPVFSFPDFSQLFTLSTDASDVACGTILMQEADNGKKKVIAVASHTINSTEQEATVPSISFINQRHTVRSQDPHTTKYTLSEAYHSACNIPHHHNRVARLARISLTLSRHLSLSCIAPERSCRLHPVSSQSCCI